MEKTTLNISPDLFWGLIALVGILALTVLVNLLMTIEADSVRSDRITVREALGLPRLNLALFLFASGFWAVIVLSLTTGLLWVIWQVILSAMPQDRGEISDWRFLLAQIVTLTGVLGAVIALPFTLMRIDFTRRQTKAAEQGLITDRISKSIDQLGHDNTAVRMGAIHSLERIMIDSDVDHVMVKRTLNAYLKYRQADKSEEDDGDVPTLDIDIQAALDVILRWRSE